MKPAPLLTVALATFLALPSPASSRPASQDYAVYTTKLFNIHNICFNGDSTW